MTNKPAFLINFDARRDDRTSVRWAMWKLLSESYGFDLAVYTLGVPLTKYPVDTPMVFNSIPQAQRWLSSEWVFLMSPTTGRSPYPLDDDGLKDFTHPDGAVYVLGPEYVDWDLNDCKADHMLWVETPRGSGELHTLTVAAIVAYDHWRKK